jgi:hypothetical protein
MLIIQVEILMTALSTPGVNERLNEVQVASLIYFPRVFLHELTCISGQGRSTDGIPNKPEHRFRQTVFIPGMEKLRH